MCTRERRWVMARQEILDHFEQNFGLVPDFLRQMPDPVLEQYTNTLDWVLSDTKLSARDKALVAFGAASAIHCPYWVPFHSAQFALNEMGEEHIAEASWVAQSVSGASAYLHGVDYSEEKFREELRAMVEYIKRAAQEGG
jgi:alkylhydroperoxidase/carboxymuconolactone decarboxylase family protein YurZ